MTDHLGLELCMASTSHRAVQEYIALHEALLRERPSNWSAMVHQYYDLVTDLYEFVWGQSFHSAPRRKGESFRASVRRYEKRIGQALASTPGSPPEPHWLDLGCGVGGPMRTIAREFGARITGINIHPGQIERAPLQPLTKARSPVRLYRMRLRSPAPGRKHVRRGLFNRGDMSCP